MTVAALASLPAAGTDVVIATAAGWTAFMTEVNAAIANSATTKEELAAISENLTAADKAIVNEFTAAEQAAIDKALEDIGAIGAPSESFGTIAVKDSAPADVAANVSVQHTAGSATVYLNIKGNVPAALQMTVEQLLGYLTTDANETISFVSCTQKANGTAGDKTMYASAMDKIIVTVGTCETQVTINVTTENAAPTFQTVTWTSEDILSVKVKDPKTQAGIKAGDTVTSGQKFLTGVVLEVAFDKDWNSDLSNTEKGTVDATKGTNTLTVASADIAIALTAKATSDVTATGVTITSLNRVVEGVTKVPQDVDLTFTIASGTKLSTATANGTDVSGNITEANGTYTLPKADVATGAVVLTATQKSVDEVALEAAAEAVKDLDLGTMEKKSASELTATLVKAYVVEKVNAALEGVEGVTAVTAADVTVKKASADYADNDAPTDGNTLDVTVSVTLKAGASATNTTAIKDVPLTLSTKSDATIAAAAVKAAIGDRVSYAQCDTWAGFMAEIANRINSVDGVTAGTVTTATPESYKVGDIITVTYTFSFGGSTVTESTGVVVTVVA